MSSLVFAICCRVNQSIVTQRKLSRKAHPRPKERGFPATYLHVKCSNKINGYADTVCDLLTKSLNDEGSKSGIVANEIWNLNDLTLSGYAITLYSGDHKKRGVILNICPFCGGNLIDLNKLSDSMRQFINS